jgi:hypothetical protein
MLNSNTRQTSRLTLALGGLLIAATASAADVQSQAREILTGHRPTHVAAPNATPTVSDSANRSRVDAQQQAADVLLGASRRFGKSPSTRVAILTPATPQSAFYRQLSNSQEMAKKVVLGTGGE